ncbi:MAG: DUF6636 domain-containing protein [Solirubrobacterales bacterium]
MKRLAPVVLLVVLAALFAGCGGGGTKTTVIEKTVTVETPSKGGGPKEVAAKEASTKKSAEEAREPQRIIHLGHFRTPSGNIGCVLSEGGARCDIRKRDWKPLPRPASCPSQTDYGQGLQVAHGGQASFVCAGDTALEPGLASLSYGTAARVGGSECISRDDGVTCVNQAGHGFFISVQSYQVF